MGRRSNSNNDRYEILTNKIETLENNIKRIGQEAEETRRTDQLSRTTTLDIQKPQFSATNPNEHPKDFIHQLNEYFRIKQIREEEKMFIVGSCLQDSAYHWYSTVKFNIRNYQEFTSEFIEEFWSKNIQLQVWSICANVNRIQPQVTYRDHFAHWANKLRHLEVLTLNDKEIIEAISDHFPGYIRSMLMQVQTIIEAMRILGKEEQKRRVIDNERPLNNNNNRNNNDRTTNSNNQRVTRPNTQAINTMQTTNTSESPYIQCKIEGEVVELLVDTGASISVLTKEVVDNIIRKNPSIPQLPISGVQISNAIGKKVCKISKQIFCECKIGQADIQTSFVQVENLNEKGIIGADVLNQYQTQINFEDSTIEFKIDGEIHVVPFFKTNKNIHENIQQVAVQEPTKVITKTENHEEDETTIPLNTEEEHIFHELIDNYHEIFQDQPGRITPYECNINFEKNSPIHQKPYPIPVSKQPAVTKEIQRMEQMNIIEPSASPWSSPIIPVTKRDGTIRLCLDARKINTKITPDRECPLGIEEILTKFQKTQFLSSIDLTSGYWQCPLRRECREITAFLHQGRNYQFQVLPFGLINSVAEFQKILNKILGPEILKFAVIYVDDIHVSSKTFKEHVQHLQAIFNKFREHKVTININKSKFFRKQIRFLGHIISTTGIMMDPEKTRAIQNFHPPRNKKQIQSFLGFINFYRKYIRNLSQQTTILSKLTQKNVSWQWNDTHQTAFDTIKTWFLEDIVIKYPDFNRPFYIYTDASTTHLGAELFQTNNEEEHQTLGFVSRALSKAEANYSTTELELLAILFACKKFRMYILGHKTYILTDHKALTFLKSCQLLNAKLLRWTLSLQEYDLNITYISGKENVSADTLTRYPQNNFTNKHQTITINTLLLKKFSDTLTKNLKKIKQFQLEDPFISTKVISKIHKQFIQNNNIWFFQHRNQQPRLVIPASLAFELINEVHQHLGHVGGYKTYRHLKQYYYFKNMYNSIKKSIRTCETCQKTKIFNRLTRGPTKSLSTQQPLEIVSIDLMGPLPSGQFGAKYILAIIDIFSKYIKLYTLRRATTNTIIKCIINKYIPLMGPIQAVLTDNGTQFHSKQWTTTLDEHNIRIIHTTTYNPESNPVERANREIGRILRTYCSNKHTRWPQYVETVEHIMNNTIHSTTEYTPHHIIYGKPSTTSLERVLPFNLSTSTESIQQIHMKVRRNTIKHLKKRKMIVDKGKIFPTYQPGQWILVKNHSLSSSHDKEISKLFDIYQGPYEIKAVYNNNTVDIKTNNSKFIRCNFRNIRPYFPSKKESISSNN
uniref:RNA-directed DNA polymerase n=1 Tax=Sipha flava TaxID=143950 RepID=A0A2S2R9P6_9HEMI